MDTIDKHSEWFSISPHAYTVRSMGRSIIRKARMLVNGFRNKY